MNHELVVPSPFYKMSLTSEFKCRLKTPLRTIYALLNVLHVLFQCMLINFFYWFSREREIGTHMLYYMELRQKPIIYSYIIVTL